MRRPTRRAALAALAVVCARGTQARAATRPRGLPLTVALLPNDDAALPYYARATGVFERVGLDVEIRTITDAVAMRTTLAAGGLDVAYDGVIAAAVAHENDPPFVLLAPANEVVARDAAAGLLVVPRTSSIRTAADLAGKTVAVTAVDGLAALAVRRWADLRGGDSAGITFVEIPGAAIADALAAGRADAASIDRFADPSAGRDADPLRIVANTYDAVGSRWLPSAWLATPVWIVRHPDEAQRFAAAMKATAVWANAHHPDSAAILAKVLGEPVERIDRVPRAAYASEITPALIEPVIALCARYGVISAPFPAADLIDPLAR